MISVIIPTLNAQYGLAASLSALVPATIDGLVREVIIVDGGSQDDSLLIAEEVGAKIIRTSNGRGHQLALGGREAKGPWLLFLHADTILEPHWSIDAEQFMQSFPQGQQGAAAFRFALNDKGLLPRFMEFMVGLRSQILKLPYGDQGLLIHKDFYDEIGGYAELPLMEDVEIVRRIGARRMHILGSKALTSAVRYRSEGYARRISRNLYCLGRYFMGAAPAKIARTYEDGKSQKTSKENRDARS
jgi:rSAM/selenodomain-associated transferase 2